MKLINANELKEWVESWFTTNKYYHPYSKSNNIPIDELYDILEQIPTMDPEPVRRGEWKWVKVPKGADFSFYQCSICGEARWVREKYCANCGTLMEAEYDSAEEC